MVLSKAWGEKKTIFLALGNLAISLLALINSLALPPGTMAIIWIIAVKALCFQEIYAE